MNLNTTVNRRKLVRALFFVHRTRSVIDSFYCILHIHVVMQCVRVENRKFLLVVLITSVHRSVSVQNLKSLATVSEAPLCVYVAFYVFIIVVLRFLLAVSFGRFVEKPRFWIRFQFLDESIVNLMSAVVWFSIHIADGREPHKSNNPHKTTTNAMI